MEAGWAPLSMSYVNRPIDRPAVDVCSIRPLLRRQSCSRLAQYIGPTQTRVTLAGSDASTCVTGTAEAALARSNAQGGAAITPAVASPPARTCRRVGFGTALIVYQEDSPVR